MGKLTFILCFLALCGAVYSEISTTAISVADHTSAERASPISKKPVTTQPPTTQLPTTQPPTTQPPTTQPPTTQPPTTQPPTTQPPTTQPLTTQPPTTQPLTTQPLTTQPLTTQPLTTEPATTQPTDKPTTGPANYTAGTTAPQTPTPQPDTYAFENKYNVTNNETKEICLLAKMTVQFVGKINNTVINVTKHANVDTDRSSCRELVVQFENGSFSLLFNNESSYYFLDVVKADINGVKGNKTGLKRGQTSLKGSYLCSAGFNVSLNNNFTFVATDVQFQAFDVKNGTFGAVTNCKSDLSPIIPIVVGCVLAVLVLIVIIAYLIGRRRSRSGYEEI